MSNRKKTGTKTRREQMRERRRKAQQRQRAILVLIFAGAALLVAGLLIYPSLQPVGDIVQPPAREHPQAEGTGMGDPDAPVVVEEFSDFQCPACRFWHEDVAPLLIENYVKTGQVYFVYRNYPFLDDRTVSKESDQSANASMCAAEQGRFWDYHDILFANQTGENIGSFSDRRLLAYAETLNLDMQAFEACFGENRYLAEIEQSLNDGRRLGVTGTPAVALNGQLIIMPNNQVVTFEDLKPRIDALLAPASQ